jgi:hypothetical protein
MWLHKLEALSFSRGLPRFNVRRPVRRLISDGIEPSDNPLFSKDIIGIQRESKENEARDDRNKSM